MDILECQRSSQIEGLTTDQHLNLFTKIHSLLQTSPTNLLLCHRHLLNQDFHDLGNGETIRWQLWIASMESALSAASHVSSGNYTLGSLSMFHRFIPISRICWSSNHHSQSTARSCPPPLRRPRQQTLPHHSETLHFLPQQLHSPSHPHN